MCGRDLDIDGFTVSDGSNVYSVEDVEIRDSLITELSRHDDFLTSHDDGQIKIYIAVRLLACCRQKRLRLPHIISCGPHFDGSKVVIFSLEIAFVVAGGAFLARARCGRFDSCSVSVSPARSTRTSPPAPAPLLFIGLGCPCACVA